MARTRTVFRCMECATPTPQWAGRCSGCGEWNTLEEEEGAVRGGPQRPVCVAPPRPITEVDGVASGCAGGEPTGVAEFDRVLGGGLAPGSVTLLGGEPGVGKSTLLLQVLAAVARQGRPALLVSAEESASQVRVRADRLGIAHPRLWITAADELPAVVRAIHHVEPSVVVVDSIQTVAHPELGGAPGTVAQVRACAQGLATEAKERNVAVVLVGHVTKDGSLAGPRVLEHLVDTVLSFDGDRHHALRLLRARKHRFGATGEVGLFEMTGEGMAPVADPSGLLLGDRRPDAPGSVVLAAMEGQRAVMVEVQALVAPSPLSMPRRTAQGLDAKRMGMVLAVLGQRAGVGTARRDVWASAVGGVKVVDPGADLAVAVAVASAVCGRPVGAEVAVVGEIGLAGEVRQVAHTPRRLAEAARMGLTAAIVPVFAPDGPSGLRLHRVATVTEALLAAGVTAAQEGPRPGL